MNANDRYDEAVDDFIDGVGGLNIDDEKLIKTILLRIAEDDSFASEYSLIRLAVADRSIDKANETTEALSDPQSIKLMESMKGQVLMLAIEQLGGKLNLPIRAIDASGNMMLSFSVDNAGVFHFETSRKS